MAVRELRLLWWANKVWSFAESSWLLDVMCLSP